MFVNVMCDVMIVVIFVEGVFSCKRSLCRKVKKYGFYEDV